MITKVDIVHSNLIRYFNAIQEVERLDLKLEELKGMVDVHSPNFTGVHGYSGTRDEKLNEYSYKKSKLDDERLGWFNEVQTYYNILHLREINNEDISFLSLIYKDKLKYSEVAKKMYLTDKSYVCRKKDSILEKLAKFI